AFGVMAVSIRALAASLSIVEILTLRAGVGLAIIGTILAFRPELRRMIVRRRLGLHALRNTIHFGAQYLWAMSLLLLPLATVFALEFTMPAWTMLLAAIFLGERMTASRAGAIILGLAGVFVGRLGFSELPAIAGLGVAGLFAHYCLSNAFRAGEASLVVPLDFLRIPLIALVGWWFYAEPLDITVFAGAGLIVIGIVWNLR